MENNKETATTPHPMIIVSKSQCCETTAAFARKNTMVKCP